MTAPGYDQAALLDLRRRKDEAFRAGRGGLPPGRQSDFAGLRYFAPDPQWCLTAAVAPAVGAAPEVCLDTSDGRQQWKAPLGEVTLRLPGGEAVVCLLLAELGEERPMRAFLPFRDLTSGVTTYGAGRYLDVPLRWEAGRATATLDFNRAYHPYCAYADSWSCPLPPAQNHLPAEVLAGERL